MLARKATLIQDIQTYIHMLKPLITRFIEPYLYQGLDEENTLQWIIEEEIERVYYLFTNNHCRNLMPYSMIYHQIRTEIASTNNYDFSQLTTFYIKAPRLYADNNRISLRVDERDLYMDFYTDASIPPF